MSQVLAVFAHPSHNSYNFHLLQKVVEALEESGHDVQVDDLFALQFDPVMTEVELYSKQVPEIIRQEQIKVAWSDLIVFIFPIWWWGPPAILKGWLERVFCLDFAFKYDVKQNGFVGTLQGKKAVIIISSSSDPSSYTSNWQAAAQANFVSAILEVGGIAVIKQLNFYNVHQYSSQGELNAYLSDAYDVARAL